MIDQNSNMIISVEEFQAHLKKRTNDVITIIANELSESGITSGNEAAHFVMKLWGSYDRNFESYIRSSNSGDSDNNTRNLSEL